MQRKSLYFSFLAICLFLSGCTAPTSSVFLKKYPSLEITRISGDNYISLNKLANFYEMDMEKCPDRSGDIDLFNSSCLFYYAFHWVQTFFKAAQWKWRITGSKNLLTMEQIIPDTYGVEVSIDRPSAVYLGFVLGACIIVGIVIGAIVAKNT